MRKLATVKRLWETQGAKGIGTALRVKYADKWIGRQHNWWYGKLVERRGNVVTIDGCRFSLDSPAIATEIKSSFLFKEYEKPEREAIRRFLDPALPVVEFGGAVGVVSCLVNRRLADPRRHVVVEANPALIPILERNRELNGCRFEILPRMVGYGGEQATFYASRENFLTSAATLTTPLEQTNVLAVKTVSLRALPDQRRFEHCALICDIEGGEAELVRHESEVLRERVALLILELHDQQLGAQEAAALLRQIENLGFQTLYSLSNTYVMRNSR